MKTITIFVRQFDGGCWVANTLSFSASHPTSREIAAQRAAAAHFHVPEEEIQLMQGEEPHVLIASVRARAPLSRRELIALGIISLIVGCWAIAVLYGGAR